LAPNRVRGVNEVLGSRAEAAEGVGTISAEENDDAAADII
jgi:hypothetical protein